MDEETIAEMKRFGVRESFLARTREELREDAIEVEPENVDAVRAFLALATQWRYQPRTNGKIEILVRTGLDYSVLPVVAGGLRIETTEGLLAAIRTLEAETLAIDARRNRRLLQG